MLIALRWYQQLVCIEKNVYYLIHPTRTEAAPAARVLSMHLKFDCSCLEHNFEKHLECLDAAAPDCTKAPMEPDPPDCMLDPCSVPINNTVGQKLVDREVPSSRFLVLGDAVMVPDVSKIYHN